MKRIDTLDELKREKVRLKIHLNSLEGLIENDFHNIKESLKPANLFLKKANSLFVQPSNGLLNVPVNATVDFLLRKVLLRNSGFIVKLFLPFFAKNMANNFLSDKKSDIVSWFGKKFTDLFRNHKHETNDENENHSEENFSRRNSEKDTAV